MIICHHFLLSLNNFIQLFFSGSADSLLKKNAEPILHIAGLDVTIVKVQDRSVASHRLLLVCITCHNLFSHTTGSHSKQMLQPLLHYQHNDTESSITTMLSPQKKCDNWTQTQLNEKLRQSFFYHAETHMKGKCVGWGVQTK